MTTFTIQPLKLIPVRNATFAEGYFAALQHFIDDERRHNTRAEHVHYWRDPVTGSLGDGTMAWTQIRPLPNPFV